MRLADWHYRGYDRNKVAASHSTFIDAQSRIGFYQIDDLLLVASPGVYHPGPGSSTVFMLRNLPAIENARILEVGSGTGTIAIHYARRGNRVALTDIDPEAVRCASFNALVNRVAIETWQSDVFSNVPKNRVFDVILFNLPFFQRERQHPYDHVGCDPKGQIVTRFVCGLRHQLTAQGAAYVTYSNLADKALLLDLCRQNLVEAWLLATELDPETGVERHLMQLKLSTHE